jgi:hypothetical protein
MFLKRGPDFTLYLVDVKQIHIAWTVILQRALKHGHGVGVMLLIDIHA